MRLFVLLIMVVAVTGCQTQVADAPATDESQDEAAAEPAEGSPANDGNVEPTTLAALSLSEAVEQVKAGSAVLVDVRSDKEWNEAHFEQAQHICIDKINEDAAAALAGLDKEKLVLLH